MQIGKRIRLSQWFHDGRSFVLAIDQAVPRGVYPQIKPGMAMWADEKSPWDVLLLHQGQMKANEDLFANGHAKPFIIKLTSNSKFREDTTYRSMITSVKQAAAFGAVGVAINLFVGSTNEAGQLTQLGDTVSACEEYGMPLMVLANPAGAEDQANAEKLAYACMIAGEMGADIVKTEYPGTEEGLKKIIDACMCPVLVEESPHPYNEAGTLLTVEEAMRAGASGACLGCRIYGEKSPLEIGEKIRKMIYAR